MAETPGEIKAYIDEKRIELEEDLDELRERAREAVDWRAQVRKRPAVMMGAAFGAGMLLSLIGTRSSARQFERVNWEPSASAPSKWSASTWSEGGPAANRQIRKLSNTIENFMAALIGLGTAKVRDYVEETIPGFREYYEKAEREKQSGVSAAA